MKDEGQEERKTKTAYITERQDQFIKETAKNFSMFVRQKIEEAIEDEGWTYEEKE
jgi:predicted DNA-binding protein